MLIWVPALRADANSMSSTGGIRCASLHVCYTSVNGIRNTCAAFEGLNQAFLSLEQVSFASIKTGHFLQRNLAQRSLPQDPVLQDSSHVAPEEAAAWTWHGEGEFDSLTTPSGQQYRLRQTKGGAESGRGPMKP